MASAPALSDVRCMADPSAFPTFFVAGPRDDYVPLARTRQGRLFRKHILTRGPLIHPSSKQEIDIDGAFLDRLVENFDNGVCDIVQVPLANDANAHVEAPDRNVGEVVGLERDGDKLYALIDARKHVDDFGKTLLGASAFINTRYVDTRTGENAGPTLLHVAVTNRPYVTGLEDYQELAATATDDESENVLLTHVEKSMTLDEILASLKEAHGIDVASLQATAKVVGEAASALSLSNEATPEDLVVKVAEIVADNERLSAGVKETLSLSNEVSTEDLIGAVKELAEDKVALTGRVDRLEKSTVETEVDGLVKEGRVLPAQRDAMVSIALSNRETFDALVPANPIVKLANEKGVTNNDDTHDEIDVDAYVANVTGPDGSGARSGYKFKS